MAGCQRHQLSALAGVKRAVADKQRVRTRLRDARRTKSLEVLIPILYLKGISTGDFEDALIALLGRDAGGLSASTIGRLKEAWSGEHARWSKRDLSTKRYIYFWVDGIHVRARHLRTTDEMASNFFD